MTFSTNHLDREKHAKIAKLLTEAQACLDVATHLVSRASYTDETMRCQKRIQQKLIDPLRTAWNDKFEQEDYLGNPYPSVGYLISG